jgi:hypothetical protein
MLRARKLEDKLSLMWGKDIDHIMPTEHNDNKRRAEKPNQERTETRHTD